MKYTITIVLFFLFFCSCKDVPNENKSATGPYKPAADSGSKMRDTVSMQTILHYDSLIAAIDSGTKKYLSDKFIFHGYGGGEGVEITDSSATVYYDSSFIVKCIYLCNVSFLYFDNAGQLFAFKYGPDTGIWLTDIYQGKNFSYEHSSGKYRDMGRDSANIIPSKFEALKTLYDVMQFEKKIKYKNVDMPVTNYPNLITFKDIDLKKMPNYNSETIEHMPDRTTLTYLAPGNNQDSVNGIKWIWYKVKTENGKEGWIFGCRDNVDVLNDENGE